MSHSGIFHYFHRISPYKLLKLNWEINFFSAGNQKLLMRNAFIVFLFSGFALSSQAQPFWVEDFGFDPSFDCSSTTNDQTDYFGFNGQWSVTDVSTGFQANKWYISSSELGGFNGDLNACGGLCQNNPFNTDQTLHIGLGPNVIDPNPNIGPDLGGATYLDFGFQNVTDTRAESPVINCTGQWGITLDLWFIAGQNAGDYCAVEFNDGSGNWVEIAQLDQTEECNPDANEWDAFSIVLPAAANDNPDVQIGFRWRNNGDGAQAFPVISAAIDNIRLTSGPPPVAPVADFEITTDLPICENNSVVFSDLTQFDGTYSNGSGTSTYTWTFDGGDPGTITGVNETNPSVFYEDPGIYDVTLVVEDNIGESAPEVKTGVVEILDCGPVVSFEVSNSTPCAFEECVDFTDLSTTDHPDGVTAWNWTFESADGTDIQTSTLQNPTNVCLNVIGFYNVTLAATDADLTETLTINNFIEVLDCTGPEIAFTANRTVICPGECIQLTDQSTTTNPPILSWNWSLPGGQAEGEAEPDTSTQQNPLVCYETAGTYDITLSAMDAEGVSAITQTITITVDECTGPPEVGIGVSQDSICTGDCVDYFNQSLGLAEEFVWTFEGINDPDMAVSNEEDPSVICYQEAGTYNVTLIVSNSNGQVDSETFEDFITVSQCINPPVPRIEVAQDTICAGDCVDYIDESTGIGISEWQWNFQGTVEGSEVSTEQNPTGICYDNAGTYDVSLQVSGAGGDSLIVFNDVITVVADPECRPTIEVMVPDTLCAGDCALFSGDFFDADSVRWTFQGGIPESSTVESPGLVCFPDTGEYVILVEAWNAAGSASPEILDLYVGPRPPLDAGPDRTINSGATITLTGTILDNSDPQGDFLWQPFELVDNFRQQSVNTSPQETTTYIVYYSEEGTCTANDTVQVFVNFVATVGVPTAFSPNGDGVNDELKVLGQGISRMKFRIFNRYGQLVFETFRQEDGWDGTQNGKELDPGTFVYTLEVIFAEGGIETYTGDVTLTR